MGNSQFFGTDHNMTVSLSWKTVISLPPISAYNASSFNVLFHKTNQRLGRNMGDSPQTNPSYTSLFSSSFVFYGDRYQRFIRSAAPPFTRSLPSNVSLVYLHGPEQLLSSGAHHCSPQTVQPSPCSVVAAKTKHSFQPQGVGPVFLTRNVPYDLKPLTERFASIVKYRASRYRCHPPACAALEQSTVGLPRLTASARRALKSIRPPQRGQVHQTRFLGSKPRFELKNRFGVVFHTRILHVVVG